MKGKNFTEYTFDFKGVIKVTVDGKHTEENCELAMEKAIEQVKKEIDQDWIDDTDYDEYTDYEEEE